MLAQQDQRAVAVFGELDRETLFAESPRQVAASLGFIFGNEYPHERWEPVGFWWSRREFGCARTDF